MRARGNSVQQNSEKIENFLEGIRASEASDDAGFYKKGFAWTLLWQFMTLNWQDLEMLFHVETYVSSR